jgi:small subunit ribosomal protein S6
MVTDKEVEKSLRSYELTLVLNPGIDNEEVAALTERLSQFIAQKDGMVIEVNQWGKRQLAYPIKHFIEGNYLSMKFKLQPGSANELEKNLRKWEEILRFLLIRAEE